MKIKIENREEFLEKLDSLQNKIEWIRKLVSFNQLELDKDDLESVYEVIRGLQEDSHDILSKSHDVLSTQYGK